MQEAFEEEQKTNENLTFDNFIQSKTNNKLYEINGFYITTDNSPIQLYDGKIQLPSTTYSWQSL